MYTLIQSAASGTKECWLAGTQIIPYGVVCYESTTGKLKMADGANLYKDLPYISYDWKNGTIQWAFEHLDFNKLRREAWESNEYIRYEQKSEDDISIVLVKHLGLQTKYIWCPTKVDINAVDWEIYNG